MFRLCRCGWSGHLEDGDLCPKCGAPVACAECGDGLHGGAMMIRTTDGLAAVCAECFEDLESPDGPPEVPDLEPTPEVKAYDILADVESILGRL